LTISSVLATKVAVVVLEGGDPRVGRPDEPRNLNEIAEAAAAGAAAGARPETPLAPPLLLPLDPRAARALGFFWAFAAAAAAARICCTCAHDGGRTEYLNRSRPARIVGDDRLVEQRPCARPAPSERELAFARPPLRRCGRIGAVVLHVRHSHTHGATPGRRSEHSRARGAPRHQELRSARSAFSELVEIRIRSDMK
jgi:hypothetical protein